MRAKLRRLVGRERFDSLRAMTRIVSRAELEVEAPLDLKVRAWRRGFKASCIPIYGIENIESGLYVSDYVRAHGGCAESDDAD